MEEMVDAAEEPGPLRLTKLRFEEEVHILAFRVENSWDFFGLIWLGCEVASVVLCCVMLRCCGCLSGVE